MVVSFEDINDKFDRVFGFIRRDLERILELEVEGNFAIALLITCACETLAKFRYGSSEGSKVFRDLLPGGPHRLRQSHSTTFSGTVSFTVTMPRRFDSLDKP